MIESIQIKNFRGIREGQIEGFRKFNLLVGPNNSGKSAVLEALYFTGTLGNKKYNFSSRKYRAAVRVENKDFLGNFPMARVSSRHNYITRQFGSVGVHRWSISVPYEMNQDHPYYSANISNAPASMEGAEIAGKFEPEDETRIALFGFDIEDKTSGFDLAQSLVGEDSNVTGYERAILCWNPELTFQQVGSAVWLVKGKLSATQQTLFFDMFTAIDHLPMKFFRQMIVTIPGWTQKIAEHYKTVFGIEKSFNVQFLPTDQEQKWAQGWIAPADQIALTIDSYGDGARSAFKLLTPLLALRELVTADAPGLFLWEEPELFQNPQTLNRLLTEVADLLKGKTIQVFLATHSLEVVANFVRLVHEGHLAPDEMAAIRLNLNDGKLSSSIFDHADIQQWTEMDLDVRVPSGKVDSPLMYQFRETADATESADVN